MKNFRLNSNKIKSLICTGIMTLTFTGCGHFNKEEKPERQTYKSDIVSTDQIIDTVLVGNQLISVEDVKVVNSKNNSVIENVDGVLVDGKIMNVGSIFDIFYSSDIEAVLVGNELISVDDLKLVVSSTNEEISSIDSVLVEDTFIKVPNATEDRGSNNSSESNSQKDDDYEELTDEKFYELCDTLYKKYTDAGLAVSKEGVTKYAMVVNIDKLALDNPNLINNIVNGENIDEFFSDVNLVISAIISENFINWCEKGLGTNSFLNASDAVFDEKQKEIVKMYEEKVYSLEKLINNPSKFNAELSYFLEECIKPHSDLFNLESGPGYATMLIVMNVITGPYSLGTTLLDSYNTKEMKNFVIYSGATKEEENNSRVTGYYSDIKDILDDCNVKTLTK